MWVEVPQAGIIMAALGFGLTNAGMKPKVQLKLDPGNFKRMSQKMRRSLNMALDTALPLLRKMAQEIKAESKEIVPERDGLLRSQAFYRVGKSKDNEQVSAQIGYHVEEVENRGFHYAWIQHETPDPPWQHTDGRRYKYLSEPIERREDDIDNLWRIAFSEVWKG